MFGADASSAFLTGKRFNWGEQPFIRGGYTAPVMAEREDDRLAIAEPHLDTVFFAGEALAMSHGESPVTMQGSMGTGLRAAREVATTVSPSSRL
jgi:monoamine oxidase